MLAGYKTYVACALALVNYAAQYLVGDISLMDAINQALPYVVGIFMRQGISTALK